jgi:hypothetical protein
VIHGEEHGPSTGEARPSFFHGPDEPLGRVVLVPFDSVSVVHRELVVEIVVALPDGNEGGDDMIAEVCACHRREPRRTSERGS